MANRTLGLYVDYIYISVNSDLIHSFIPTNHCQHS